MFRLVPGFLGRPDDSENVEDPNGERRDDLIAGELNPLLVSRSFVPRLAFEIGRGEVIGDRAAFVQMRRFSVDFQGGDFARGKLGEEFGTFVGLTEHETRWLVFDGDADAAVFGAYQTFLRRRRSSGN